MLRYPLDAGGLVGVGLLFLGRKTEEADGGQPGTEVVVPTTRAATFC
jgi:hypothetical protein